MRGQAHRLHPEDRRTREEPGQPCPARPTPGAKPAVRVAEPEAIADRLAERITADVPGARRRDRDESPGLAGQCPGHVGLVNLGPVEDVTLASADREVVPRQPPGRPGAAALVGEERGILAEEDRPIDRGVAHRGLDRTGRRPGAWVAERRDPRLGPAGAEDARVLGEGNQRGGRPIEPQPPEPRDARAGLGDHPVDASEWSGREAEAARPGRGPRPR